ncbi:uncharacterized protein V1513DRAFT_441071 [Lipomyces chichibuensis]|uniref:uncharacterized protein n=1 Tax=Lipomyces chichibuensis TaxID=1546026 RepID=UPI0033435707
MRINWSCCHLVSTQDLLQIVGVRRFHTSTRQLTNSALPRHQEVSREDRSNTDEWTNITSTIERLTHRKLLGNPAHPLSILTDIIFSKFPEQEYTRANFPNPRVSVYENFESLNITSDHVSRSKTDTYYLNKDRVLRTHTSAHQVESFRDHPTPGFLIAADVYRRDEIDKTHYPAFHQMEGGRWWSPRGTSSVKELVAKINEDTAKIPVSETKIIDDTLSFHDGNPKQDGQHPEVCIAVANHLKRTLEMVVGNIFENIVVGDPSAPKEPLQIRWIDATFPFTSPSWEMEVYWQGGWLELFGCGVTQQRVFDRAGYPERVGWAFGLGLERLAMVLFGIPDIRLFWSEDPRFVEQFTPGVVSSFKPFSKYPGTYRDFAFWLKEGTIPEAFHDNDLMDIVREAAADLVESVKLIDKFTHPNTKRNSLCYRVLFQSMERTLQNDEINVLQDSIRDSLTIKFGVELR